MFFFYVNIIYFNITFYIIKYNFDSIFVLVFLLICVFEFFSYFLFKKNCD